MNLELIIFDCDGVLVDSEVIANGVFADYLDRQGLRITARECTRRYVGLSLHTCRKMIEADGTPLPESFVDDLRNETLKALSENLDPIPGVRETLESIQLPVCVASSGSPDKIRSSLIKTGLIDFFGDHLFSADEVMNGKPAPELFLHAARRMDTAPQDALVLEDSRAGVQAGVAAGMTVVGFTGGAHILDGHGDSLRELGAHHIINDMKNLPSMIEAINAGD